MAIHEGPRVLPGRYPGPAKRIHRGPTPQQEQAAEDRAVADALAGRICAAAAIAARSECRLLDLIGEFDATDAVRWWTDIKSVAHWLSWTCSMSPGVAREHVRVARALRRMPTVRAAFEEGRLSYSKVRELTRVVDLVEEERLCELALTATAAQLAIMISSYRASSGRRLEQQQKRSVSWRTREDGVVELRARLPAEEGAVLAAALGAARDQFGRPPTRMSARAGGSQVDTTPVYSTADALLDVARGFLTTAPEDRSGEDRTLVVVQVSASSLGGNVPAETLDHANGNLPAETPDHANRNVPAETPDHANRNVSAETPDHANGNVPAGAATDGRVRRDVPAGTSTSEDPPTNAPATTPADLTCHLQGIGPVEPETAQRFACDSDMIGAVVDRHGGVLALGRTQRFVSRAQRRALVIRDRMCRFPGCAQTRHLKAHHIVAWSRGGPTDLPNLILLCQFHHTAVHEGGMQIERSTDAGVVWRFVMPDGTPHKPWYDAEALPRLLQTQLQSQAAADRAALDGVTSFEDPAARTIRPRWAGERFDLHACVEALWQLTLPEAELDAA